MKIKSAFIALGLNLLLWVPAAYSLGIEIGSGGIGVGIGPVSAGIGAYGAGVGFDDPYYYRNYDWYRPHYWEPAEREYSDVRDVRADDDANVRDDISNLKDVLVRKRALLHSRPNDRALQREVDDLSATIARLEKRLR